MLVYIAGPYSAPGYERTRNLLKAMDAGLGVMRIGHAPLVPHLSHFLDDRARHSHCLDIPYEDWMKVCLDQLEHCDALLFLGSSPGADRELARAKELGMPVYHSLEALARHQPEVSE